jgi:hypothetical protein
VPDSAFNAQGTPVAGGYAQPGPGITEELVVLGDRSGNSYVSTGTSGTTTYLGTSAYRDSIITVQNGGKATAPTAATVLATVTPGTAGKWECTITLAVTGTTVAATDSNNFAINQTSTAVISPVPFPVNGTTGSTAIVTQTVVLNLSAADTVNVTAIANATASSIYSASVVARRVG